ncbi:hypothetical protein HQ393_05045 [Chitinibacter bivalviorum]|uniref:Uncharacterized protein n=1 Tax=Chitinibacter bivalviorum TaxID=2739434 RepID=A0A7H9BIA3_9NEIS|nr:hypothetical protein [Chitinibacter bivalviorum]QLG87671.1 hypothetical protein HQ393_05045 [Chitinibacter bivalviorum]
MINSPYSLGIASLYSLEALLDAEATRNHCPVKRELLEKWLADDDQTLSAFIHECLARGYRYTARRYNGLPILVPLQ